ncbi:hypothetical protein [Chitinophaga rhizosphaerae]|uniref:hypothetical protein n=1 Tax=Chitinophaga rhizosphaerae TaxID=1864947 RepID=UPI000F7FD0D6|nr:hypothetical protein [Chitinophaga rhizosphaerae]
MWKPFRIHTLKHIVTALLQLLHYPAFPQRIDTLRMVNGTRIIGELRGISVGTVQFKGQYRSSGGAT